MEALFRSWLWKIAFGGTLLLVLLAILYTLMIVMSTLTNGVQV